MANQKAILKLTPIDLNGQRIGPDTDVRITIVDTDATAATFTDLGAGTVYTADMNYAIADLVGQGTTAPATATVVQPKVNRNDQAGFFNLSAVFAATAVSPAQRCGAVLGQRLRQGSSLQLIARA